MAGARRSSGGTQAAESRLRVPLRDLIRGCRVGGGGSGVGGGCTRWEVRAGVGSGGAGWEARAGLAAAVVAPTFFFSGLRLSYQNIDIYKYQIKFNYKTNC